MARSVRRFRRRLKLKDCEARSEAVEFDVLRAVPQGQLAERVELVQALDDRQEMVAGKLARLAGEAHRAVGDQDLGLADPARVKQHLAGRGVARRVLVA